MSITKEHTVIYDSGTALVWKHFSSIIVIIIEPKNHISLLKKVDTFFSFIFIFIYLLISGYIFFLLFTSTNLESYCNLIWAWNGGI